MPTETDMTGIDAMRRLHRTVVQVSSGGNLVDTLQAVVEGVLDAVGFEVAVVSLLADDATYETLAVAGPEGARDQLLDRSLPADAWDAELAIAESWGALYFVPHERLPEGKPVGWVPEVEDEDEDEDDPDAWHHLDALFTQLRSPAGDVVGVLSVDLPHDRRKPDRFRRELLEMFATQAGIAINNARLTDRLRASEEVLRQAFDGAGSGMAVIGLHLGDAGRFVRVNPAFCRMVGRREADLLHSKDDDITHPDDRAARAALLGELVKRGAAGSPRQSEKRYLHSDGTIIWALVTTSIVWSADGRPLSAVSQIEDVSSRRAAEAELARRADHDVLTGLPNRRTLRRRLVEVIQSSQQQQDQGAVLFCDIDRFKKVNDTLGHGVGDRVLMAIAGRLQAAARDSDMVARLGGDEFVVVGRGLSVAQAEELAERLRVVTAEPIGIDGLDEPLCATLSIGIAMMDTQTTDPDKLLHRADEAMYQAKLSGRDAYRMAGTTAQDW